MSDLLTLLQTDAPLRRAIGVAPSNPNIVVIGDSIGSGDSTGGYAWPTNLSYASYASINNTESISGHEAGQITADLPSDGFASLYQPGKVNVAIFQRGTNDIGNANQRTGAQTYAFVAAAVQAAQAAGFYTVVMTLLPRTGGAQGWSTAKQAEWVKYNNLVLANSASADLVADVTSDPVMGPLDAPNNPALYIDLLHPTRAGQDRIAAFMRSVLTAVVALVPRLPALRTLTLANTTPASGSGFSTAINANSRAGSKIAATSSDGTALVVQFNGTVATLSGTFSANGQPTVTITETPFGGGAANVSTVAMTVTTSGSGGSGGATPAGAVRLTVLSSLAEAADGSGYDYTATNTPSYSGSTAYGRPSTSLPANTDGYFGIVLNAVGASGPIFGMSAVAAPVSFDQMDIAIYADTGLTNNGYNGTQYGIIVNGGVVAGDAAGMTLTAMAANDWLRVRRAGSTLFAEVSRNAGGTWSTIYSTAGSVAALKPFAQTGSKAANGTLKQPFGQGLA